MYGIIFPGCEVKYLGSEPETLELCSATDILESLLSRAKKVVDIDIDLFKQTKDGMFTDELQSQYATYIYSCAFSELINKHNIKNQYCAGYSMGIYATLFHSKSILFETGLKLIETAFNLMREEIKSIEFGLGAIIGYSYENVQALMPDNKGSVELININSKYSSVISGKKDKVKTVLKKAAEDGAFRTILFFSSSPYHSQFLSDSAEKFRVYVDQIDISEPQSIIFSTIDQKKIETIDDVKVFLAENLNTNINWMDTMKALVSAGVTKYIECGAGKSLATIARFIEGDITVYNSTKFSNLFEIDKRLTN